MAQPKLDRHFSIDAIRGVAVLGIFMMNIQGFAMVFAAYGYPPAHMDMTGANAAVWFFGHVFFHMKFITIFSALFGAGIILMLGEDKHANIGVHYRRMLWLLAIGLVHAWVFWWGDILVPYAIFGMLVVLARRMSARGLAIFGGILIALTGLMMFANYYLMQFMPPESLQEWMTPTPEMVEETVALYQSGFMARLPENMVTAMIGEAAGLIMFGGRVAGVMMLGMALFKWGFLTLRWSFIAYAAAALVALGIGIPASWYAASHALETGFAIDTLWVGEMINYGSSLLVAFGYAATVMALCKLGPLLRLVLHPFAAAGRMAFTNYLSHTLIATFIFVGPPGLGMIGEVERVGQFQIVVAVWVFQLIFSTLWLSVFRFGPMEWVWRSLTYWKFQPLRKSAGGAPPPTPA
ncbi:DUF418 domain-containing protein [Hyphobacterium sp. SN044]|uniref:DUF418 domain-containing protein n=1 Tax=Hyphobacterium sp. SN044 TaxID=2912575 RepID=UPI001F216C21|nr:DUF418 domain-containing protein [Hyphobacterium sp. SN044]MCF8878439.1 DUF418 domain-containing protein [Hyphobacterium sp. SN044]